MKTFTYCMDQLYSGGLLIVVAKSWEEADAVVKQHLKDWPFANDNFSRHKELRGLKPSYKKAQVLDGGWYAE